MNQETLEIVPNLSSLKLRLKVLENELIKSKRKVTSFFELKTLDEYLRESFLDLSYSGSNSKNLKHLLDSNQEEFLWADLISKHQSLGLESAFQIGTQVRQGYHLASKIYYDIESTSQLNSEQVTFSNLCNVYQNFLKENDLIDINFLYRNFSHYPCNKNFSVFGFNNLLPLESEIISTGKMSDCTKISNPNLYLHEFPSFDDEMYSAFDWAKAINNDFPSCKIAIVVDKNDIDYAVAIGRQLDENFISLIDQEKVSKNSLIELALALFEVDRVVSWEMLSYLLTSPCLLGSKEELQQRFSFDADIRASGVFETQIQDLIASKKLSFTCPLFVKIIKEVQQFGQERSGKKSFSEWVEFINSFLLKIAWMSDRGDSAIEDRIFQSWSSACDSLCSFDALSTGAVDFNDFLFHLYRRLDSLEVGHPSGPSNLFILEPEQVSSVEPTHIWLSGMTCEKPRLNNKGSNLLPLSPQISARVPGVDSKVDFKLKKNLINILFSDKKEIRVSYSAYTRGIKNIKSALVDATLSDYSSRYKSTTHKAINNRWIDYDDLSGTRLNRNKQKSGGVSFFADQSACPFRGYAIHRLGSRALEEPTPGLTKKVQGVLVHEVLANLWVDLKSLDALKLKSNEDLSHLVIESIEEIFKKFKTLESYAIPILEIEKRRLKRLALEWLQFEKLGENFEVLEIEKKFHGDICDIPFSCRLDRLDKLSDGSLRVIDYKTGIFSKADFEPPRINAPQLYLYSILVGIDFCKSISVAKISSASLGLVSKSLNSGSDQIWLDDIKELAQEIKDGFAARRPKKANVTCNFCEQKIFCRIATVENDQNDR